MTIVLGLALTFSTALVGTASAHDQTGDSIGDCAEGDIVSVRVTAPEPTTIWGTSECFDQAATCEPEERVECSTDSPGHAAASSTITCSGHTHEDGHLHCSSTDGSGSGGTGDIIEDWRTTAASAVPDVAGWLGAYTGASAGGSMTTAVGIWGTHTGYVCHDGHCQSFQPDVKIVPALLPHNDPHTIVKTPW